ncbi:MAG TPA: hypothetical protein VGM53_09080 [Streptosporangiaceae bacterium]
MALVDEPGPVDGLEPVAGKYDWYEAFRQNPDQTEFAWPPTADEAAARLAADQIEYWAALMGDIEGL